MIIPREREREGRLKAKEKLKRGKVMRAAKRMKLNVSLAILAPTSPFLFPLRILGCPLLVSYARRERGLAFQFLIAPLRKRDLDERARRTYCAIYIPLLRPHLAPSVRLRESYLTSGSHKCSSCMSGARRLLHT